MGTSRSSSNILFKVAIFYSYGVFNFKEYISITIY